MLQLLLCKLPFLWVFCNFDYVRFLFYCINGNFYYKSCERLRKVKKSSKKSQKVISCNKQIFWKKFESLFEKGVRSFVQSCWDVDFEKRGITRSGSFQAATLSLEKVEKVVSESQGSNALPFVTVSDAYAITPARLTCGKADFKTPST